MPNHGKYQHSHNTGIVEIFKKFENNMFTMITMMTMKTGNVFDQDDENYLLSIVHEQDDVTDVSDKWDDSVFRVKTQNRLSQFMIDVQGVKV